MKALQVAVGGDVLDRRQAGKAADERAEQVRVAVGEVGAGRGQVPLELIRPQRGRREITATYGTRETATRATALLRDLPANQSHQRS